MAVNAKAQKVVSLKLDLPEHYLCLYDGGFKHAHELTDVELDINSLVVNRGKLSMAYGKQGKMINGKLKRFYNPKGQYFYVTFTIKELRDILPPVLSRKKHKLTKRSPTTIEIALKRLENFGLITRIPKEHHNEIRSSIIDDFIASMPDSSADYSESNLQITQRVTQYKGNVRQGKRNNKQVNTINTRLDNQRLSNASTKVDDNKYKFKPMNKNDRLFEMLQNNWHLSKSTASQIMKFSIDYKQNPKVIMGLIKVARGKVAHAYRLGKHNPITQFENINNMDNQLNRLFTLIIDPKYKPKTKYSDKYVNTTHYSAWFVASMKNFFKDAFKSNRKSNKKTKKTNKKTTNDPNLIIKRDAKGNIKYCKKAPKRLMSNKPQKLHPTSKKMQRKIQKQLHDLNSPKDTNESKHNKHGFGNYVDPNTGKSTNTQDNKRDANELKKNTPKKSSSKPSNNKSNINTQSDTKMNDKSTHVKNKDTAVGRKTELSKLRDEYNRIADDKKFKEIHSKMVNNKDTTKAERKFCINKSQRLTPISNKIQKIERKIEKDKANAIPNTADNSNDSSDEDLPF